MNVLHISDIHYRSNYPGGNPYEDMLSSMDSSFERMKTVITQVMTVSSIDLIVITGDICDEGSASDYALLKKYFDSLAIPVIVTIGNHDIRSAFYRGWCREEKDEPYLMTMRMNGINWISFDNSLHGKANGYVEETRLLWLEQQLQKNSSSIVLMHHQFEAQPGIPCLDDKDSLIKVLSKYKPLAVLNGHTHWLKDGKVEGIPFFTAPSLSFRAVNEEDGSIVFSQSYGYRIYNVNENGVFPAGGMEVQEKELAVWK